MSNIHQIIKPKHRGIIAYLNNPSYDLSPLLDAINWDSPIDFRSPVQMALLLDKLMELRDSYNSYEWRSIMEYMNIKAQQVFKSMR